MSMATRLHLVTIQIHRCVAKPKCQTRTVNLARHILVDTLSDQVVLASTQEKYIPFFRCHTKARAAIGMGGNKAHTIWFNAKEGQFTSSKAYFDSSLIGSKLSTKSMTSPKKAPSLGICASMPIAKATTFHASTTVPMQHTPVNLLVIT